MKLDSMTYSLQQAETRSRKSPGNKKSASYRLDSSKCDFFSNKQRGTLVTESSTWKTLDTKHIASDKKLTEMGEKKELKSFWRAIDCKYNYI